MALMAGVLPLCRLFIAFNYTLLTILFKELHFLNPLENASVRIDVHSPTALFSEFEE